MRIQDHMIEVTRAAAEEAFRYAKAVPADKVSWKPLDAGRSVIELCQEMAKCPDWCRELVSEGFEPDWSEEAQAASKAEVQSWVTVEQCETECYARLEKLFAVFKDLPDSRLSEAKDLPFGPGGSIKSFSMPEMMDYPRWNFTYHLGQIAYIQTLIGDSAMH